MLNGCESYFNLSGLPTIAGTTAQLSTNLRLPLNATNIPVPNAVPTPHPGIQKDTPFTLGAAAPVFDDCFVFPGDPKAVPLDTRQLPLRTSGIFSYGGTHLEISTTEPAFQLYTGDGLDVAAEAGVGGAPPRGRRAGFCVEPGRWVDAASRKDWRGMVVVGRGETWGSRTVWTAWEE